MLRVGNDIVDLKHPFATGKSRDARFLKRVFLPVELRRITASKEPEITLWALWTGKEAAYKVLQKDYADVPSIPRLYQVNLDEKNEFTGERFISGEVIFLGAVDTPKKKISLRTLVTADYVHSIGIPLPSFAELRYRLIWDVERLCPSEETTPACESTHVRNAAKKCLSQYLGSDGSFIDIRRNKGNKGLEPPCVYVDGKTAAIDISLSHDGTFVAYAFTLP